jgi:hypothetical protein
MAGGKQPVLPLAGRSFFQSHPRARPVVQIATVGEASEDGAEAAARFTLEVFALIIVRDMEQLTILNHCLYVPDITGIVYDSAIARESADSRNI